MINQITTSHTCNTKSRTYAKRFWLHLVCANLFMALVRDEIPKLLAQAINKAIGCSEDKLWVYSEQDAFIVHLVDSFSEVEQKIVLGG